jgi:hypothetical protein
MRRAGAIWWKRRSACRRRSRGDLKKDYPQMTQMDADKNQTPLRGQEKGSSTQRSRGIAERRVWALRALNAVI